LNNAVVRLPLELLSKDPEEFCNLIGDMLELSHNFIMKLEGPYINFYFEEKVDV
jgi:hypothetical protein